ncbi:MAG: BrnT family toxin [Alphaproteobacteria bacterium]|nr:BrnT family toxin [Alphaproteobacteria bacterium]
MFIWDEAKNSVNQQKHGLAFKDIKYFDWDDPVIIDRSRHEDGEHRLAAIDMLYEKLHTVIFTHRGEDIRIISLRRANTGEEKIYAKTKEA